MPAEVIPAALHVADLQRTQDALEKRDILEEQLLLQILCSSGDDDPVASGPSQAQGGQQICQGLAGACPGLDDQVPLVRERLLNGLCHLILSLAVLERQSRARQQTAWREKLMQGRQLRWSF